MLDYAALRHWDSGARSCCCAPREARLYALSLGFGADPLQAAELRYVRGAAPPIVPTMASVLGFPTDWWQDRSTGIDCSRMLHGEQRMEFLQALPADAPLAATSAIEAVADKGAGKGAIAVLRHELRVAATRSLVAVSRAVVVLRGDGGYSAGGAPSDPLPAPLPAVPASAADVEVVLPTLPQQALLYSLTGDDNPLHSDPALAQAVGFPRPILHGLCTYGMAARALLRAACDYDPARLASLAARFTAPVLPGETLRIEIWRGGGARLQLRARVLERDAIVLDNGVAELRPR